MVNTGKETERPYGAPFLFALLPTCLLLHVVETEHELAWLNNLCRIYDAGKTRCIVRA